MALRSYRYVGSDDLATGPWPDNEPAVTGMDWKTGQPNAKYYAIGSHEAPKCDKEVFSHSIS